MSNKNDSKDHSRLKDGVSDIVYQVDERPPFGRSIIYGFQHIFAMILGSITGGVIIGETIGLSAEQIGLLIGYINFAVGIATIIQVTLGVRLPMIQGSTSGHVPAYLALGSMGVSIYADPILTMRYLSGALLVGAAFQFAIGATNILKVIRKLVSPITVGIVIVMVGLGLWEVVTDFVGINWHYAIGIIALVMIFSFAFGVMIKTMALFSAVIVGYVIAALGTWIGFFSEGHALWVDFQTVQNSGWLTWPKIFPWGAPKFNWGFILAMTIPYITASFESFGDYIATLEASGLKPIGYKRVSRGIAAEGAGSIISSLIGGTATSSFSQNVGVIRLSGVASRFVCVVAGVLLLMIGLFGKFGALLATIPRVILGAVYLTAFGILVMTGFRLIIKAKMLASRNEILIGTSLLLGLALPAYFKENPLEMGNTAVKVFFNVFLSTPMLVSGLWAFLLDNLLPGTQEERGMQGWMAKDDQPS